jgi:hypothetical protein
MATTDATSPTPAEQPDTIAEVMAEFQDAAEFSKKAREMVARDLERLERWHPTEPERQRLRLACIQANELLASSLEAWAKKYLEIGELIRADIRKAVPPESD